MHCGGHIYFSIGDKYVTFLENSCVAADLNKDQYYYFDGDKAEFFNKLQQKLAETGGDKIEVSHAELEIYNKAFYSELKSEKIIQSSDDVIIWSKHSVKNIDYGINSVWPTECGPIPFMHIVYFIISFIIGSILHLVRKPKITALLLKVVKSTIVNEKYDRDSIIKIYTNFTRMRKYFYTSLERCYYDSIVTMMFFSLLGYKPQWVFAVLLHPFKAHCWVQIENTIINDDIAHVTSYRPILSI